MPYEDYEESVKTFGVEATKALINFRGGHLAELVNFAETELTEEAAKYSEIRKLEIVDCVFDERQWTQTRKQLAAYLEDFPEQKDKWRPWEADDAQKVRGPCNVDHNIEKS